MKKRTHPIWFGARLAQRVVPEKRVITFAKPVGDPALNALVAGDRACEECGHLSCGCVSYCDRCACEPCRCGTATAPREAPKPAGQRDPYEAAGHPWARVVVDAAKCAAERAAGVEHGGEHGEA